MDRRSRCDLQAHNPGDEMTTESFSLVFSRIGFQSAESDAVATQLSETIVLVTGIGRAPAMLAIGLAVLSSGFANQAAGAENQEFSRATPLPESIAIPQDLRRPGNPFPHTTTSATDQEAEQQRPALDFSGLRLDVRPGLHIAPLPEWRGASIEEALSSGDKQMLDSYVIAGLLASAILRKTIRATEMQNQVQAKADEPRLSVSFASPSAGSVPTKAWSLGVSGTAIFRIYDHATLAAYLPMKGLRTVQKIAEKVFESQAVGSFIANMQALSLLARGRINTEFTYSTQFNKYSRLDASAIYRLNSSTNTGKSDLVIGLFYRATF